MIVAQIDAKHRIGQSLRHDAFHNNLFLFIHSRQPRFLFNRLRLAAGPGQWRNDGSWFCQYLATIAGYQNRMFKMCRRAIVFRFGRPTIGTNHHFGIA